MNLFLLSIFAVSFAQAQSPIPCTSAQGQKLCVQNKNLKQRTAAGITVQEFFDPNTKLQFKIGVPTTQKRQATASGHNVLLHGDGGNVYFTFPNIQTPQTNLMGVAVLAPNQAMRWGCPDQPNANCNTRPNGPNHAKRVQQLLTSTLPAMGIAVNNNQVFFTGVSGGSLLLTSAIMPLFGQQFNAGMMVLCGGLPPQNQQNGVALTPASIPQRVHFQSTAQELASLQKTIPQAIAALASTATPQQLSSGALTVDPNPPQGSHCAFDGKNFFSGVQLMVNNFASVMFQNTASGPVSALSPLVVNGAPVNPFQ
ncbi:hypothetical protein HDV03_001732 [Kappamyces sp. JEL0829]|nr:hypothetical protein HDV03_001732 [Kappamyces sp. JEL0829]